MIPIIRFNGIIWKEEYLAALSNNIDLISVSVKTRNEEGALQLRTVTFPRRVVLIE